MATRFQDDGRTIWSFIDDILVECPRCGACAHVLPIGGRGANYAIPRRVTCLACGYARDGAGSSHTAKARPRWEKARRDDGQRRQVSTSVFRGTASAGPDGRQGIGLDGTRLGPVDTFRNLPLYLQTPCAGHTFWALNPRHLTWVESFLAADLREDAAPTRHKTAVSILPQWLILARHRDEALRAAARLREKLLA